MAQITSNYEKCLGVGIEDDTTEESREGERDLRFRLNKTLRGVGGVEEGRC